MQVCTSLCRQITTPVGTNAVKILSVKAVSKLMSREMLDPAQCSLGFTSVFSYHCCSRPWAVAMHRILADVTCSARKVQLLDSEMRRNWGTLQRGIMWAKDERTMCVQSTVNAAPAIRLLQLALCVFMAVAADCVGLLRHQQQQLSRPHPAWDAGHLPHGRLPVQGNHIHTL